MTRLAALLSIAIATSANAQQLLHPGDTAFAPARVRLDVDTIVVLVTPPDSLERLSVTLVRRLERVEAYGQAIYRETQRYQQPDGAFTLDTLDVSARSLRCATSPGRKVAGAMCASMGRTSLARWHRTTLPLGRSIRPRGNRSW